MAEELKACGKNGQGETFWKLCVPDEHCRPGLEVGIYTSERGLTVGGRLLKWTELDQSRAQLPSQGGEAVGEVHPLSDGKQYAALYTMAGQHLVGEKLYTHPAEQVADDLTMVKVSRELLQDLRDLAFDQVEHHRAAMGAYKQTRQSAMDSVLAQADALMEVKP